MFIALPDTGREESESAYLLTRVELLLGPLHGDVSKSRKTVANRLGKGYCHLSCGKIVTLITLC